MTIGIRFLYTFLVGEPDLANPGSNVISVTSTATGDHDKKNLCTSPLRETWRSTDVDNWQEIIIEANDTTERPDVFAILNHNFTSTVVVQLQGSMSSDFSAPAITVSIPYNKKHMVLQQDLGTTYNYYRFRILDPNNSCGYVEIGRIIAGKALTIEDNEDISDNIVASPQDLAYKTKTEGFFRAFSERVKVERLSITFNKLRTVNGENDNYANLLAMFDEVGETYPFLTIVDPGDLSFKVIWGAIDQLPSQTYTINRYVDLPFTIQEFF